MTVENNGFLPVGMRDILAEQAVQDAWAGERLMELFSLWGYQRVSPPLLEFRETRTPDGRNPGADGFQVMDPVSGRILVLRPDITPQIGRIAGVRLRNAPRPLRLCYAGQVVRAWSDRLRPGRQYHQAGLELVGPALPEADIEIITVTISALGELGIRSPCVDVAFPELADALFRHFGADGAMEKELREALEQKNSSLLRRLARRLGGEEAARILGGLLAAVGPADAGAKILTALELPAGAARLRDRLVLFLDAFAASCPDAVLTVDPGEWRGFSYDTGPCFSIFIPGTRDETGRGGRYVTCHGEHAAGVSLYLDILRQALPQPQPRPAIYVPCHVPPGVPQTLRKEGWRVIRGLGPCTNDREEARRLGCATVWPDLPSGGETS